VLVSLVALAADVSGKWKAEFTTPDGTQRVNTFTFKVDDGKLTGTVAGSQDETPIADGKVAGDEISFSAERPFGSFTQAAALNALTVRKEGLTGTSFSRRPSSPPQAANPTT
jgi:hypothetical protein